MQLKGNSDKTKIRLNHSRYSHAYKLGESLWEKEIQEMLQLICKHLLSLGPSPTNDTNKYSTDLAFLSIALFGTYGSGKSSLLRTFYHWVNDIDILRTLINAIPKRKTDASSTQMKLETVIGRMHCLPLIEPNLQAQDDQFLYAFLAQALEADLEKNQKKYGTFRDTQILSPVQQAFQEVCEYLKVLDSNGRKSDFDPLGVSLERLERHTSGLRLQEKIGHFLDTLAHSLCGSEENSVILMPVDDSDMSLEGLVSTLDTVRRYLQHPRLVPIFTFTGRLAEELLQVHFERRLILDKATDANRLKEASTELSIAESLAIQYLGKLFPVRNRIKLGPAAARVQLAEYLSHKGDNDGREIFALLQTASRVLFGYPEWSVLPSIRSPLRSSTLRRQLQIVDVMQESGVPEWVPRNDPEDASNTRRSPTLSWAIMFDQATWALLNVHRDVLKEYQLNLDDLYSWTPKGLRQVILTTLLNSDLARRQQLIKHWRYRTEDRRSQMLSLLAANAFRPRMYMEEQTGDDPLATQHSSPHPKKDDHDWHSRSFSLRKGSIWFFQLWIGFYLPQILARSRSQKGRDILSGVGWDLRSGPIHAVREALVNKEVHSPGMLFLNPEKFSKMVKDIVVTDPPEQYFREQKISKGNPLEESVIPVKAPEWSPILLQIWSCYGTHDGGVFAAVSLWRGMGLLAQILKADVDFHLSPPYQKYRKAKTDTNTNKDTLEKIERRMKLDRQNRLKATIYRHLKNARVLGYQTKARQTVTSSHSTKDNQHFENFGQWRFYDFRTPIHKLTIKIIDWLDAFDPEKYRIEPMSFLNTPSDLNTTNREDWKACFVRRIHGENIMSLFWEDLENYAVGELSNDWDSLKALHKWCAVLAKYWDCGREFDPKALHHYPSQNFTQALLMTCPFVKPFTLTQDQITTLKNLWVMCLRKLLQAKDDLSSSEKEKIEEIHPQELEVYGNALSSLPKSQDSSLDSFRVDKNKRIRELLEAKASVSDLINLRKAILLQKDNPGILREALQGDPAMSLASFSEVQKLFSQNEISLPEPNELSEIKISNKVKDLDAELKDLNPKLFSVISTLRPMISAKLQVVKGKLESIFARVNRFSSEEDPTNNFPEMGWQPRIGWGFEDERVPWLKGCQTYLLAFHQDICEIQKGFDDECKWVGKLSIPRSDQVTTQVTPPAHNPPSS